MPSRVFLNNLDQSICVLSFADFIYFSFGCFEFRWLTPVYTIFFNLFQMSEVVPALWQKIILKAHSQAKYDETTCTATQYYTVFLTGLILHECFTVPELVHIHFLQSSNNSIFAQECLPCSIKVFSNFQEWVFFACDEVVGRDILFVSSLISWSLIEPWLGDFGPWAINMVALPVCWNHGDDSDGIFSYMTRNI